MRNQHSTALSVSDAATWAFRFLGREWRLAAPVALAFLVLPSFAVQLLVPGVQQPGADVARMATLLAWMVPVALIGLVGGLTLTALALTPGGSVGEAVAAAGRRFGPLLLALAAVFAAMVGVLSLFSLVGTLLGASIERLTAIGRTGTLAAMLVAAARLMPLLPVVLVERLGPIAALRRAWALTAGHFWRLLGLAMLMMVVAILVTLIAQQTVGVVTILLGRATGQALLFRAVGTLLLALVGGAVSAVCHLIVAGVYRHLARR